MRASSLPIAQHCSLAPTLPSVGGRAASLGTATHALVAANISLGVEHIEESERAMAELSQDDQALAHSMCRGLFTWWEKPLGAVVEHEFKIGDWLTGHWDLAWKDDRGEMAFVVDWKTGAWDRGRDFERQLQAYALGAAAYFGVQVVKVGRCYLREYLGAEHHDEDPDPWEWDVLGPDGLKQAEDELFHIARRNPVPTLGAHCLDCWSRPNCPAFTANALDPHEAIGPDGAIGQLLAADALRKMADVAEARARSYVERHGRLEAGGKVYAPWPVAGKRRGPTFDELRARGLGDLIKQGEPGIRWEWRKR